MTKSDNLAGIIQLLHHLWLAHNFLQGPVKLYIKLVSLHFIEGLTTNNEKDKT